MGVQSILTIPTTLESHSLVFSYGLDLFFARVTPSKTFDLLNEDFSKMGLMSTIGLIGFGIWFVKEMVLRKKLNESWQ